MCTLSLSVSRDYRSALKRLDAAVFDIEAAWGDSEFDSPLAGKFDVSVLACVDAEVAGFAVASIGDDGSAHLHRIAVDPVARKENVGRKLVNAVEKRATNLGAHRLTLECPASLKVGGFYEKLGYTRALDELVSDYLARKGKTEHERLYLPLRNSERLVYFKPFISG